MPPEYSLAGRPPSSASRNRSSSVRALAAALRRDIPYSRATMYRFS